MVVEMSPLVAEEMAMRVAMVVRQPLDLVEMVLVKTALVLQLVMVETVQVAQNQLQEDSNQ